MNSQSVTLNRYVTPFPVLEYLHVPLNTSAITECDRNKKTSTEMPYFCKLFANERLYHLKFKIFPSAKFVKLNSTTETIYRYLQIEKKYVITNHIYLYVSHRFLIKSTYHFISIIASIFQKGLVIEFSS